MTGKTRIYIGRLPKGIREKDIDDMFRKYGKIEQLDFRTNKEREPFAFIDYSDPRDAEDAIRAKNGYELDGVRIRVEFPRSYREREMDRGGFRGGDRDRGGGFSRSAGFSRADNGGYRFNRNRFDNVMRRSQNRVLISGLPTTGSWQDLKDHMRKAGDVCYADVSKDGTGVVEFVNADDMRYAIKKLDDTKFRSHEGETTYIRVRMDDRAGVGGLGGDRGARHSRSPSFGFSRRRSRSPLDRRSPVGANGHDGRRGRSPLSRSPMRSKSRSRSRSPL